MRYADLLHEESPPMPPNSSLKMLHAKSEVIDASIELIKQHFTRSSKRCMTP